MVFATVLCVCACVCHSQICLIRVCSEMIPGQRVLPQHCWLRLRRWLISASKFDVVSVISAAAGRDLDQVRVQVGGDGRVAK